MPPSSSSAHTNHALAVSRIHRLLRPLRNKCTVLAALPASATSAGCAVTTYGSARAPSWADDGVAPLERIPPPRVILARTETRMRLQGRLELARKVWDVLDAWGNVLQAALGKEKEKARAGQGKEGEKVDLDLGEGARGGVGSLMAMCAAVVGENMQGEVERAVEEGEGGEGEEVEMKVVNELYEAVEGDVRRWTLVSHALSIILDTCPHHPTLLNVLLEQTLSYKLPRAAHTLLTALLSVALGAHRSPAHSPPICHPAHSSYLRTLHRLWTSNAPADITRGSFFSERAFMRILDDVLAETESPYAWTCKSVARLVRDVRERDFGAFVGVVDVLAGVVARKRQRDRIDGVHAQPSYVKNGRPAHPQAALMERLAKWMRTVADCDVLISDDGDDGVGVDSDQHEDYQVVVDFVVRARDAGLHHCRGGVAASDVQSVLVCIAVQCLTVPRFAALGPDDRAALTGLLHEVQPATATCDELVERLFHTSTYTPPASSVSLSPDTTPALATPEPRTPSLTTALRALRSCADTLRAHALHALEAAFWVCALRHFEQADDVGGVADRERARAELMDAVGEAEQRVYGEGAVGGGFVGIGVDELEAGVYGFEDGIYEFEEDVCEFKNDIYEFKVDIYELEAHVFELEGHIFEDRILEDRIFED
ncbi:hypothetical protein DENSPDRAFT_909282 [Dentipellis sp. KUC8613]|nr:hypothetical protein DENSPDRAFT_909282 [Dentipellis sp. KUC8613]